MMTLADVVDAVIEAHPDAVTLYRLGQSQALGYLFGQVMVGRANAKAPAEESTDLLETAREVQQLLRDRLDEPKTKDARLRPVNDPTYVTGHVHALHLGMNGAWCGTRSGPGYGADGRYFKYDEMDLLLVHLRADPKEGA